MSADLSPVVPAKPDEGGSTRSSGTKEDGSPDFLSAVVFAEGRAKAEAGMRSPSNEYS